MGVREGRARIHSSLGIVFLQALEDFCSNLSGWVVGFCKNLKWRLLFEIGRPVGSQKMAKHSAIQGHLVCN
jgi:hypothetical protein